MSDVGAQRDADLAAAAFDAMVEQAEATLAEAVGEAPIESGDLKASGHIVFLVNEDAFEGPGAADRALAHVRELAAGRQLYRVDAELRFDTPYARYQHDQLKLRHTDGGKAKYLEHPIQRANPQLDYRLRQVVT